jgi:hypothetical protein
MSLGEQLQYRAQRKYHGGYKIDCGRWQAYEKEERCEYEDNRARLGVYVARISPHLARTRTGEAYAEGSGADRFTTQRRACAMVLYLG